MSVPTTASLPLQILIPIRNMKHVIWRFEHELLDLQSQWYIDKKGCKRLAMMEDALICRTHEMLKSILLFLDK